MNPSNHFWERDVYREKVIGHWKYLKENLDPSGILDELLSEELINEACYETIKDKPRVRQVDIILTYIVRKIHGIREFLKLSNVLSTANNFIVEHLETPYRGRIDLTQFSDNDINRHRQRLRQNKTLLKNNISPKEIVDDFLERFVIKLDDHEKVCFHYNTEGKMAKCLVKKICDDQCTENGSYICLLESLGMQNNDTNRVLIEKLTSDVLSTANEQERKLVSISPKSMTIYPHNTTSVTDATLTLKIVTGNNTLEIETEIIPTIHQEEHTQDIRVKFAMNVKAIKRSSVVIYLESIAGDVKLKIENSILNGNITEFVSQLFKSEAVKRHLLPGLYIIEAKLESSEYNPFNIIKANRLLLEEEFDPLPLINDFRTSQGKLNNVPNVSRQRASAFKTKFEKSGIDKIPERRKRVQRFLDIIEDDFDAETFWEYVKVYGNAYLVNTLKNDLEPISKYQSKITVCSGFTKDGLIFEGEYEVLVKNEPKSAKISQANFDSKYYKIEAGKVLVLNNRKDFQVEGIDLADRTGSDRDASNISQRFAALPGFEDYELATDLTRSETFEWFGRVKRSLKNNPVDCLVLVLLSHGDEDGIYATDGLIRFDQIVYEFNAENCPKLRFKPKIIITQACRGTNRSFGMNIVVDPNQPDALADSTEYLQWLGMQIVRLPNEADFLFAYATVPGGAAFRDGEFGTPYIKHLSEAIEKMEVKEDLYSVLTTVNKTVGLTYHPKNEQIELTRVVQMPCFVSHLTKILCLKQK